jgi:ABC-type polar amino acid transport system ATPase subunit
MVIATHDLRLASKIAHEVVIPGPSGTVSVVAFSAKAPGHRAMCRSSDKPRMTHEAHN